LLQKHHARLGPRTPTPSKRKFLRAAAILQLAQFSLLFKR
jgi:hypothetical protein